MSMFPRYWKTMIREVARENGFIVRGHVLIYSTPHRREEWALEEDGPVLFVHHSSTFEPLPLTSATECVAFCQTLVARAQALVSAT